MKTMRMNGADIDSSMNASDRNEMKITAVAIMRPSFVDRHRRATVVDDDRKHWRMGTVLWKIRFHHCNNIVFLLVPLLLMILKETSALPPIIKIGEWQIFPNSFDTIIGHRGIFLYSLY